MEEPGRLRRTAFAAMSLVGLLLVAACASGPRARFVADERVYTLDQAAENARALAPGPASAVKVEDAAETRQRVLADLRGEGELASQAADLMTRQFPPVTKAVPFHVEAATVDGRRCWLIVEAWGGRTGTLTFRRLWVFDRDSGGIVDSRTFR